MSSSESNASSGEVLVDQKQAKLLEQAVRFLQNPKVRTAPEQSKKDFLKSKGLTDDEIDKAMKQAVEGLKPSAPIVPKYQQTVNCKGVQETHTVTFSNTVLSIYTTPFPEDANIDAAIIDAMNAALDRCEGDSIIEVQVFYPASDNITTARVETVRHQMSEALQRRYGTSSPVHLLLSVAACAEVTVRIIAVKR